LDQGQVVWSGNHQFVVDYFGGTGNDLVVTAIPEPSCGGLLIFALAAVAMVRSKRKVNSI
jgi:hypothetical protein